MIRQNLIKAQGKEIVIHRFLLIVGCADWTRLARVARRRNGPGRSRALALPDLISIVLISIVLVSIVLLRQSLLRGKSRPGSDRAGATGLRSGFWSASQADANALSRYAALEAPEDEPVEAPIQAAPSRVV